METYRDIAILLIGKTGHGKSATGNSILQRTAFETSSRFDACTKYEQICSTEFQEANIKVVDTPGLDYLEAREKPSYHFHFLDIPSQFDYRVDALLVVVKFAVRFTQEDLDLLHDSKKIFGDGFMDHCIIIVSGGDHFNDVFKDKQNVSFQDWAREQTGCFRQLYEECGGRCVLFNNKDKEAASNGAQVRQLLELVKTLKSSHGSHLAIPEPLRWRNRAKTSNVEVYEKIRQLREDLDRAYPRTVVEVRINELKEALQKNKLKKEKRNHLSKLAIEASEDFLSWSTVVAFVTAALRHMGSFGTRHVDSKTEHIKPE